MVRKIWLILTLFSVIPVYLKGQNIYAVDNINESLKERADATVRDERLEIDMKSINDVTVRITRAVTVHNKNGEEHGDIELYYNKSRKIRSVKGEIFNEFGISIGKFSLKDFRDRSASGQSNLYDDTRMKNYSPAVYSYPYTIAYSVEIKENQNLVIPSWSPDYAYDVAIEQSSYVFTCRPTDKIRIHQNNYVAEVAVVEDAKTKIYTWELKDIPARRSEPYSPPRNLQAARVRIVPEAFQYFKKTGYFKDWQEFGKWNYDYLLSDKRTLPETTVQHVRTLTKDIGSPKEKAKALYKYMQDKTRYISIQVGIGGIEPFPAETVDRLGYGDCKALVNYMQSLLDIVDIPSYYCIVEAGSYKRDITVDFANVSDGNHIILCIPFENDTTWLECTNQKIPFGFLSDFTDDRLVIACSEEGGKILRTPKFNNTESLQYREGHFKILADGSLEGSLTTTFKGGQFDNHYYNMFLNQQDQARNVKNWYDIDNISFQTINYEMISEDKDSIAFCETLELMIKNYVVRSGKHAILLPNIFNQAKPISATRNRTNDLYINRGYTDVDVLHYILPDDVDTSTMPVNKRLETEMGIYELRISISNGILTCYRMIQLREGTYPKEKYAEFYQFMTEVYSSDRGKYNLSIGKKETISG
ncbi:DUF3857 domain-containing protein [Sphingobacterium chuzhouense]|uniref:DUF3857 domain-containing protein n=1 Tax=Sphingobacterium chuzhouense TaxID=1742264 RepID=A0ABR7XQP6_9SPHI|nr:DUF3857 domain-containing protein [Sphingobacterium chuzhouense]MBD1421458.1 DUF3857 domain-containing protein [Sphingobacterium chuzhouense]